MSAAPDGPVLALDTSTSVGSVAVEESSASTGPSGAALTRGSREAAAAAEDRPPRRA